MLESEVTQQQYIELMNANPSQNYQCGKECPVDSVTWENAVDMPIVCLHIKTIPFATNKMVIIGW